MKPSLKEKFEIQRFFRAIETDLARVDQKILQQVEAFDPAITGYVEYCLKNGGKRIRPALVLLSGRASGECGPRHLELAVILELVHLATLVHDDILDNASLRRGVPTMKAKWGTEISVLLGDCLFAHALKLCTRFDDLHIARVIASASNEVCTGEIIQTQRRFDLKGSVDDYLNTIRMKTGALFRTSTELAAYLNGCQDEDLRAFRNFGEQLGTAYQIYDDCLDLTGDESKAGKTLGTDLIKGKLTLPVLHMIRQLPENQLENVSKQLLQNDVDNHDELIEAIRSSGGLAFAVRKARELLESANRSLQSVTASPDLDALSQLTTAFSRHLSSLK